MSFREILRGLVESLGAEGAVMLAHDGELVDFYASRDSIEMDLIGAHFGVIFNIVKDVSSRYGGSAVESVAITTGSSRLVISSIKEGYCLVTALGGRGSLGRALVQSKKAVARIEEEMG
ncbi:MAG: hypothetical protein HYV24_07100 [Deltaproteobacteria bacterium]|nr:hypothetical protein [Deltaproteobacteria bacterium]